VDKLARMHCEEPTLDASDLGAVKSRTLVMVGDDDAARPEHATAMYRSIRDAELMGRAGTSDGLLVELPDLCNNVILDFLIADPVPTIAQPRNNAASKA
jgi:hypothetical protein